MNLSRYLVLVTSDVEEDVGKVREAVLGTNPAVNVLLRAAAGLNMLAKEMRGLGDQELNVLQTKGLCNITARTHKLRRHVLRAGTAIMSQVKKRK